MSPTHGVMMVRRRVGSSDIGFRRVVTAGGSCTQVVAEEMINRARTVLTAVTLLGAEGDVG